jgi:tRNA pseudouridine38-40 synthase
MNSRYRLLIEYDGSRFHGWQQNAGVKTIQGEMLIACEKLFNTKKIELYGAGRTDAGVHATGQVAHLEVPSQMHGEDVADRLNELLPSEIHILKSAECDPKFHARHSAVARSYVYVISRRRSAFGKKYTWWVKEDLSIKKMQEVAALLRGFHDFSSFGAATSEEKSTKVNINVLEIKEAGDIMVIHIIGSHFLWMMVRRITGVLVHAGKGKLNVREIQGFLKQHSERPSQLAAPPSGLYLQRIYYPGEPFDYNLIIPVSI